MQGVKPIRTDRGRTRVCLLLHGWITTPLDFGRLPQALDEAGWDVCAPLHAGHGTDPRDLVGITAQDLLDAARLHYADLQQRYGNVSIVGFSMGGTIATLLAAEQRPDKLVLIAPFCGVRYKWYYVLPPRWWHALLCPFLRRVKSRPRLTGVNRREGRDEVLMYGAFPTDASRALFELRHRLLGDADLRRLTMPALLVYSTGDDVCSPSAMEEVFERLPAVGKEKAVFSHSNHHILHDYDREQAITAIVNFLRLARG